MTTRAIFIVCMLLHTSVSMPSLGFIGKAHAIERNSLLTSFLSPSISIRECRSVRKRCSYLCSALEKETKPRAAFAVLPLSTRSSSSQPASRRTALAAQSWEGVALPSNPTESTTVHVVLPCLNEERVLRNSTKRLLNLLESQTPRWNSTVTIVDNGSCDRTYEIAQELASAHPGLNSIPLDAPTLVPSNSVPPSAAPEHVRPKDECEPCKSQGAGEDGRFRLHGKSMRRLCSAIWI
jgi:hypothetical protein